jgi:hypothetical protein
MNLSGMRPHSLPSRAAPPRRDGIAARLPRRPSPYTGRVPTWIRRRPRPASPRRPDRREPASVARVELSELRPDPVDYLGQAAATTLALVENAGRAIQAAPTTSAKSALAPLASSLLASHEGMIAALRARGADVDAAMAPFAGDVSEFQRRTQGQDWYEILLTCYLTSGFLIDFFDGLAGGLPEDVRTRVSRLLRADRAEPVLVELLQSGIAQHPRLASRLAMWGRRLVGDTMLVARAAVRADGGDPSSERTELVISELIAQHTRRMDALGLTA